MDQKPLKPPWSVESHLVLPVLQGNKHSWRTIAGRTSVGHRSAKKPSRALPCLLSCAPDGKDGAADFSEAGLKEEYPGLFWKMWEFPKLRGLQSRVLIVRTPRKRTPANLWKQPCGASTQASDSQAGSGDFLRPGFAVELESSCTRALGDQGSR